MLAYLFWHGPRGEGAEAYERSLERFHGSLAARSPVGFLGSVSYRAGAVPWLDGAVGYEDWYFLEDYTALGVLGEAAVSHGHRSAHERIAQASAAGAGGVYRLLEGAIRPPQVRVSVWVTPARTTEQNAVTGLLMADGADREHAALWRRELVLGPAPEYCLLGSQEPAGVADGRLPANWRAVTHARELLWGA